MEYFKLEQLFTSPARVGFSTVKCAHGEISLPVPAALELLSNIIIFVGEHEGE